MAQRLVLVAAGPTGDHRRLVFGSSAPLEHPELVPPWVGPVRRWGCGPEPAVRQTAAGLGAVDCAVLADLREVDLGAWTGRPVAEVAAADPAALQAWLSDPDARPHGGESLTDLVARVGRQLDTDDWPDGRTVLVVTALVARAAATHALGAPAPVLLRLDVGPLGRVGLSRSGPGWRLQELGPARTGR